MAISAGCSIRAPAPLLLLSTGPALRFQLKAGAWLCKQRTGATLSATTVGFLSFSVISAKAITCPSCKNIYKACATRLQQRPCIAGLLRPLCLRPVLCCHRQSTYAIFFSTNFSDSTFNSNLGFLPFPWILAEGFVQTLMSPELRISLWVLTWDDSWTVYTYFSFSTMVFTELLIRAPTFV